MFLKQHVTMMSTALSWHPALFEYWYLLWYVMQTFFSAWESLGV